MIVIGNKRPAELQVNTLYRVKGSAQNQSLTFGWFDKTTDYEDIDVSSYLDGGHSVWIHRFIGFKVISQPETFWYSRDFLENKYTNLIAVDPETGIYTNYQNKIVYLDPNNVIFDFEWDENPTWVKLNDGTYANVHLDKQHRVYSKEKGFFYRIVQTPDNRIKLEDGVFLFKEYGKYMPNLSILSEDPEINWISEKKSRFNLGTGSVSYLIGDYFVSKKGTNCFRIKKDGKHMLLRDEWGGPNYPRTRGGILPKEGDDVFYYRRASSNGGGTGYDYSIVPNKWEYKLSILDI